jgi:hypothetical protein
MAFSDLELCDLKFAIGFSGPESSRLGFSGFEFSGFEMSRMVLEFYSLGTRLFRNAGRDCWRPGLVASGAGDVRQAACRSGRQAKNMTIA